MFKHHIHDEPDAALKDARRWVREYGCVRCQKYHREGLDPEFDAHRMRQSKHGVTERPPLLGEVFRRLVDE